MESKYKHGNFLDDWYDEEIETKEDYRKAVCCLLANIDHSLKVLNRHLGVKDK